MKKVIFLKNESGSPDPYREAFGKGYECEFVPLMSHGFVNQDKLREFLIAPEFASTDAIIITSQRAVEAVNSQSQMLPGETQGIVICVY
jgi:hypothetical protein